MFLLLKKKVKIYMFVGITILLGMFSLINVTEASAPQYKTNFSSNLTNGRVLKPERMKVDKSSTLRDNISNMFYPREGGSVIYDIIRDMTLGIMILFFVVAGASLLLNKKPEESRKHLSSLLYIMLGGVLVYAANRIFGTVFTFNEGSFTSTVDGEGLSGFTDSLIGKILFLVLSAIKAAAFFMAIIMTVVTGFKVMGAGDGEKGKKLAKGLLNVVVALFIIKGVDFVYYLAADSSNFVENASNFIINIAKVFGWLYGVITVIMVIVAGYLYITDGGSGSNFKKASNIFVNIILSALVLFGFLLIVYQIFAEFQTGGDAITDTATAYVMTNQIYT